MTKVGVSWGSLSEIAAYICAPDLSFGAVWLQNIVQLNDCGSGCEHRQSLFHIVEAL
jgi:hypothetical protein